MRDSLKNPLHFVGIRQSAPTVKEEEEDQSSAIGVGKYMLGNLNLLSV